MPPGKRTLPGRLEMWQKKSATRSMTIDIKLGDIVRLRKAHPCGSYEWEVVRVGADIGLKCLKCQRRVLLARDVFGRRVKEFVSKSD
jgi:hypothetical protein